MLTAADARSDARLDSANEPANTRSGPAVTVFAPKEQVPASIRHVAVAPAEEPEEQWEAVAQLEASRERLAAQNKALAAQKQQATDAEQRGCVKVERGQWRLANLTQVIEV